MAGVVVLSVTCERCDCVLHAAVQPNCTDVSPAATTTACHRKFPKQISALRLSTLSQRPVLTSNAWSKHVFDIIERSGICSDARVAAKIAGKKDQN